MPEGLLGTTTVTQVGLVVRDIEAAARAWSQILGLPVPNIIVTDPVERAQTLYHGHSTPARARLAFFQLGQVSLELIEPIDEPSTWNDQLVGFGPSLHHIAFEIDGMKQVLAALSSDGLPTSQTGEYEGGRYAYVEGGERLGAVIELLEND